MRYLMLALIFFLNVNATFKPTGIVVHHTNTPEGKEYTYEQCREFHTGPERRWSDCGYHFIIQPSGRIDRARPSTRQGAHCGGSCNKENYGVAFAGKESASPEQLRAFSRLVSEIDDKHTRLYVSGHSSHKKTACPGHIIDQLKELKVQYEIE